MATTTPYKRDSPFLHRIWKSTIDFVSSSTNGEKSATGDHSPRPVKRRRVTDDSLGMNGFASVPALFQQPPPADAPRVLRVEVLRIWRNDGPKPATNGMVNGSPVKKDTPVIRARCKITIFKWIPDLEMRPLYCDSQTCTIKEFCSVNGVCEAVRIHLPQPFEVAAEKLYIERNDNQGFDLDDSYLILAELESFGDPNWPPRYLLQGQENPHAWPTPPRMWSIQSQIKYAYTKGRVASQVRLRRATGDKENPVILKPYWMDMDLRWTASSLNLNGPVQSVEGTTPPDVKVSSLNGALEPLTNGHVNGRAEVLVNGQLGEEADGLVDDEELEGEATTPNRPLRNRGKPQTYNLKKLSDQARGKEPKERKKRKLGELSADSVLVTWLLPSGQRCTLDSWSCIHCFATHLSVDQLKMHMYAHREFKYAFDHNVRTGWRVAITNHGQQTPRSIRSYDYFEPISADEGESDGDEDESPQKARGRSRPKSIPVSGLDDMSYNLIGVCSLTKIQQLPKTVKPRETKQLIPQTSQALYDRLSKCRLESGSWVDEPQIDNSWLLQKHRDIIKDYSDVHPDEKEYAAVWDAFASKEKATMAPHLQDVYLDFVREKATWIASSQNRMNEAMKHLAYMKARDALSEDTVVKALAIARQARLTARYESTESKPATSPKIKSRSGCNVCGLSIAGPGTLICSNLDCGQPMYHHDCIRDDAKIPVERGLHWRCNECYDKEKENKEAAAETVPAATDSSAATATTTTATTTTTNTSATATTTVPV